MVVALLPATYVFDPQDVAVEGGHERGLADELQRRRQVERSDDGSEGAVLVDPQQFPAVGQGGGGCRDDARESPWDSANSWPSGPTSTSTMRLNPDATSFAGPPFTLNETTLPVDGSCGTGPACAM